MKPRSAIAAAALVAAGSAALWSCRTQGDATVNTAQLQAANSQFFQEQIRLAREALARQEWEAARQNLEGIVDAVPATDPLGAEARAGLAEIAFELGDYQRAIQVAAEVPPGTAHTARALEYRGLAQLFSCDFDAATQTFYQLAEADPPRGRVWLGVAAAWTGADANADRELTQVVDSYGQSEHAPNARFYLAQLALWQRRAGPAQRRLGEINSASPDYLTTLDQRAQNWLGRRTHLMRSYFTFDTLSRLSRMSQSQASIEQDQRADQALQMLQQNPGACAPQVQRLAQARAAGAADRQAFANANRDQDGDGIPDERDRCRDQPETVNGVQDDDGCPEATAAISLEGNQIRFLNNFQINFDTGTANVVAGSQDGIRQIGRFMQSPQYQWIRRIRLEGHTDDVGEPQANMDLAMARVRRVMVMLHNEGVDTDRMRPVSYGESRPAVPGTSEDARAQNRRVEIFVEDPPMFGGVRQR